MPKRTAFDKLVSKLSKKKGVTSPKGLAAYIGRKSLGVKKFNARAAAGRRKGKR